MYYVYYLKSKSSKENCYVGFTGDLKKRLARHNAGMVESTKPYIPWELVFYEAFMDKVDAKRREDYLKTTKGRRALKIMLKGFLKK